MVSKIDEFASNKHSVTFSVAFYVARIWAPIVETVTRVRLDPVTVDAVVIDIIAKGMLQAGLHVGNLAREAIVIPVLIVIEDLAHVHRVHEVAVK